jgi:hypothetical protein
MLTLKMAIEPIPAHGTAELRTEIGNTAESLPTDPIQGTEASNANDTTIGQPAISNAPVRSTLEAEDAPTSGTSVHAGTSRNGDDPESVQEGPAPDPPENSSRDTEPTEPQAPTQEVPTPGEVDDNPDNYADEIVYTHERVWPLSRPIFLPADELPHVIPHEFKVPPFTVRYRLPQGTNTNIDKQADAVRKIFLKQIEAKHPVNNAGVICAKSAQVTFPKQQGRRDERYFSVDIAADTPANFEIIKATSFTLRSEKLDIIDVGPPAPANLITVTVNHLPSQNNPTIMGRLVAEAICKRYGEVTCHDVFLRKQEVVIGGQEEYKTSGTMVASVQFTKAPPHTFPDDLIRDYFPGWIKIRGIPYQLYYVGRINHCNRFHLSEK